MKHIISRLQLLLSLFFITISCIEAIEPEKKKEEKDPPIPALTVSESLLGSYSAQFDCEIQKVDRVFYRGGFHYGTDPSLENSTYVPGMIVNNVLSIIVTDILPNKTYYFKAEIFDDKGSVLSEIKSFKSTTFIVEDTDYHVGYNETVITITAESNLKLHYKVNDAEWIYQTDNNKFKVLENKEFFDRVTTITISSDDGYFQKTVSVGQDQSPLHFKDEAFKHYVVSQYDTNNSGEIEIAEFDNVKSINIPTGQIKDISEISFFTQLTDLVCIGTGKDPCLKDVDLSYNKLLQNINLSGNDIKQIDLSPVENLKSFVMTDSPLCNIDFSHCSLLETLCVDRNMLEYLDLSHNISLISVSCDDNRLESLTGLVSSSLKSISCQNNGIKELDISGTKSLETVICSKNNIYNLDIADNSGLVSLDCSDNNLVELYTRRNKLLADLNCSGNQIQGVDIRHNTALKHFDCSNNNLLLLDATNNAMLESLDCRDNAIETLDVESCPNISSLFCCSSLKTLFIGNNQIVEGITVRRDATHIPETAQIRSHKDIAVIPDPIFREYLTGRFDIDKDGKISIDESMYIKTINVNTDNISTLKGIEYFANLTCLKCSGTTDEFRNTSGKLKEIDLSHNLHLTQLICDGNKISTLNLNNCADLATVWCFNNNLTELNLDNNPKLIDLNCEGNQIKTLDLTHASGLKALDCSPMNNKEGNNCLETINIPKIKIDFINGTTYKRNVSNIPGSTVIIYMGQPPIGVSSFMFNYNAKDIDTQNHIIPNTDGAEWEEDLKFNSSHYSPHGEYIHIYPGTYYSHQFNSENDNPFNRQGHQPLTIIAKVKGYYSNNFSIFACRGNNYNYMLREGDKNVNYFYLHDSRGYDTAPFLNTNTLPNIVSAKVSNKGIVTLHSWTDNVSSIPTEIQWGSPSDGIAIFAGQYYGGEFWEGDFYWIFLSLKELSDEEIQNVINFNEML